MDKILDIEYVINPKVIYYNKLTLIKLQIFDENVKYVQFSVYGLSMA